MAKSLPSLMISTGADVEPSIEVDIALYLKIHQVPFLDTLIHVVFSALTINHAN
jgi:hypothetical protein